MKAMLSAVLILTAGFTAAAHVNDRSPSADDRNEVLRLETLLHKAWLQRDVATVNSIVADDFQYWSLAGARRTKADFLHAVVTSGEGETKVEDPDVRLYGDTAVYTARIVDSGRHANGKAFITRTCVTDVFVRRGGKWQAVASHETRLS